MAWLALASFALWLALTALTIRVQGQTPLALQIVDDLSFVIASLCNCFGVLALAQRFAASRRAWLDNLKQNAFGMYLVHYLFVVWLQYALLPAAMPGIVKAGIVFAGTLLLSWTTTAAFRRLPLLTGIVTGGRGIAAKPS